MKVASSSYYLLLFSATGVEVAVTAVQSCNVMEAKKLKGPVKRLIPVTV